MDKEYYIPEPNPEVYENYRTEDLIMHSEGSPVNVLLYTDYSDGMKQYKEGATYPSKGFPTPEAVFAVNTAKRALMLMLNPFMIFGWKKNKERFERLASWSLSRFYLKEEYRTPVCRELCKLPLGETAKIIGHIFEYDDAYRYRLQDVMSEIDLGTLYMNPCGEIIKLISILQDREESSGMKKKYGRLYIFAWLLIPLQFWFADIIKDIDFDNLKLDEADKYWVSLRDDGYNYMGQTFKERNSKLKEQPLNYSIKHNFM